ncbi:MAG: tetratricopeptide repeat protein [Bacteroidia bacterium]|jgi:tetratricopeptide (TPR) repeat protein
MKKIVLSIVLIVAISCNSNRNSGRFISETDTSFSEEIRSVSAKINANPDDAELYYKRGNTFYFEKKYKDAILDFETAIALNPKQALYHYKCSESLISMDSTNSNKTKEHLVKALEIKPDYPEASYLLAKYYLARQEYDKSIGLLKSLTNQMDFSDDAYVLMSIAFKEQKDTASAQKVIENALLKNPENFNAVMQKTLFLYQSNDPTTEQWASKAVRMNEFSDEALYTYALLMQKKEKYAIAIEYYDRAIKVNPNHILAHYNIAVIQSLFENYEESIDWCNKTLDLQSTNANAHCLIGFNQEKLGNKKAALQSYKTALSLDPNLTLAKEGIQSIN